MSEYVSGMPADQALQLLKEGNAAFLQAKANMADVSPAARARTLAEGQNPYAIVVTCSDSRVIPEAIFSAGIGDLFVIRVAGNVIDDHQLGSIEYAASHLGSNLVLVLGHDHCGAVDAAMNHDPEGYIKYITDCISQAIGNERNEYQACKLNALHSLAVIESSLEIQHDEDLGLRVMAGLYCLETGKVEFFE